MMNRILSLLGFLNKLDIVHGAVLPEHLLYHPTSHALKLVDWCYSTASNYKLVAMMKAHEKMYPSEVIDKKFVTSATDTYMVVKVLHTAAKSIPKRFEEWFKWCGSANHYARPQDPWIAQDVWKQLAEEEFGKPKYIKLTLPIH